MKNNHGGKREGAGAKLKYGEPTIVISIRIPETQQPQISKLVNKFLKKYKLKKHGKPTA